MATHSGIVISVEDDDIAQVKAARHNSCENCGSCPGDSAIVLTVDISGQMVRAGQSVIIEVPEKNMIRAAFMVYIVPLLSAAVGVFLGGRIACLLGVCGIIGNIIGGSFLLICAIYVVVKYERFMNKRNKPRITKLL